MRRDAGVALPMCLAGGTGTARTGGQEQEAGLDSARETMWPLLMPTLISAAGQGNAELQPSFVYRVFIYSPRVSQVIF